MKKEYILLDYFYDAFHQLYWIQFLFLFGFADLKNQKMEKHSSLKMKKNCHSFSSLE